MSTSRKKTNDFFWNQCSIGPGVIFKKNPNVVFEFFDEQEFYLIIKEMIWNLHTKIHENCWRIFLAKKMNTKNKKRNQYIHESRKLFLLNIIKIQFFSCSSINPLVKESILKHFLPSIFFGIKRKLLNYIAQSGKIFQK